MIEITLDDAIEFTRALAEEKGPEFVYKRVDGACVYVKDGCPDCIVGQYLAAKGVSVERLKDADTESCGVTAGELVNSLEGEDVLRALNPWVIIYLDELQYLQDSGTPWMVAVLEAEQRVR